MDRLGSKSARGVRWCPALTRVDPSRPPFIFAGALKYAALKTFLTPYAEAKGAKTAKASAKVKEEL